MRLGPRAIALFFLVVFIPLVFAEISSTNYKITSYAVDSGGSNITSLSYKTDFTLGEIAKAIFGKLYNLFLGFFYTSLGPITPPSVYFTDPTPVDGANQSETYVTINVSIAEDTLREVRFNWNGSNYTIFNDSVVLMMNFDNRSFLGEQTSADGNVTVDISNAGNNGSFMGDATINLTNGRYHGALHLDGNGDYVDVQEIPDYDANKDYTLSFWFYTNNNSGSIFAQNRITGGCTGYSIDFDRPNIIYKTYRQTMECNPYNGAIVTVDAFKWYHISITQIGSNNNASIYLNGKYQSSDTDTDNSYEGGGIEAIGFSQGGSYFNGTVDNLVIWNRSLSAAEIQQLYFTNLYKYNQSQWYLYVNQSLNSSDGLVEGNYTYKTHTSNTRGNWNATEERGITIDTTAPAWKNNRTNLTGDDRIMDDVWFFVNWTDSVGLKSYIFSWNGSNNGSWVNDSAVSMSGTVNNSNVTKTINVKQGNTVGWRFYVNDSAGNWNSETLWTFVVNNTPPSSANISYPLHNSTITNTTPGLNWSNATDADNDTIYYDLFIRCLGGCSVDNRELNNLSDVNYTVNPPLKYYQDDGYSYEWWIRPFDNISYGENSSIYNFTISSTVAISLSTDNVGFGVLSINQQNDTTDDNPNPFVIQNDGNSYINVNITVDSFLWSSVQSESPYFQYKIDNISGEEGAFNWSSSITSWKNFTLENATGINRFNYSDDRDSAEIDINISVPPNEPPGKKESNILFTGYYVMVT